MKLILTGLLLTLMCPWWLTAQQLGADWDQKTSIPAAGRFWGFAFSIGDKGYAGTGRTGFSGQPQADFWEYDPATDTWAQKANYPDGVTEGATGFSAGDRGFAGFGTSFIQFRSTFHEYLPATNTWEQRASVPGGVGFAYSHGFTIDSTIYIGPENGTNKFYAYNIATDTWAARADFPGLDRRAQVSFTAGGKGYIGLGFWVFGSVQGDFYCYDPVTDTWNQIADLSPKSDQSTAVTINDVGYVYNVGGNGKSIYRYKADTDEWQFVSSLPTDRIANASMFAIGDTGYIVLGESTISGGNVPSNQLWGFRPFEVNSSDGLEPALSREQFHWQSQNEQLHIELEGLQGQAFTLTLHTLDGRELATREIRQQDHWNGAFETGSWSPGLVLATLSRQGTRPLTEKILIL